MAQRLPLVYESASMWTVFVLVPPRDNFAHFYYQPDCLQINVFLQSVYRRFAIPTNQHLRILYRDVNDIFTVCGDVDLELFKQKNINEIWVINTTEYELISNASVNELWKLLQTSPNKYAERIVCDKSLTRTFFLALSILHEHVANRYQSERLQKQWDSNEDLTGMLTKMSLKAEDPESRLLMATMEQMMSEISLKDESN